MNTEEIIGSMGRSSRLRLHEREAEMLQVLGDPVRLGILQLLSAGERCASEIEPHSDLDQSDISLHLQMLKRAGILSARNDGTHLLYRVRNAGVLRLFRILTALITEEHEEELRRLKAQSTGASR